MAASATRSASCPCSRTSTRARWRGHAEDGQGQDDRVLAAEQPGGDARAHVGEGVGHRLLVALADDRGEALLGAGELHEDEEVAVVGQPAQGGPDPLLDAPGRIGLAGDGLPLGQAHGAEGVVEDLGQQLVLRFEVPVEDALADAEPVDDAGDRGGVVAVGGEACGRPGPSGRVGALAPFGVSRRDMVPRR